MNSLLSVKNLNVHFPIRGGLFGKTRATVKAVNGVSLEIREGETLGLVGESGCGKSTLGKALLRLVRPTSGEILFNGKDLVGLSPKELRVFRKEMQIIFQDPFSSLNPRMSVGQILTEPLIIHKLHAASERRDRVLELLDLVGLRRESYDKLPHEFSGGQRQRIGIARALAVRPHFMVADEPVSALDVSIQSQILNLLRKLQSEFHLTYLFISHDLKVIRYLCDRIVVMYLGKVMEILTRDQLRNPDFKKHPYTTALIASAPRHHPDEVRTSPPLQGDIPSPARPPTGCVFHPRCPEATDRCRLEIPKLKEGSHSVACHYRSPEEDGESFPGVSGSTTIPSLF
jgi:oligopeptide/dipeptide ABC transporter ATP-binding protein